MKNYRLNLYSIDMKYVRNLSKVDDNVMSVSPQIDKVSRPFVGIVVICKNKNYCIPLTSPKEKHNKIKENEFSHPNKHMCEAKSHKCGYQCPQCDYFSEAEGKLKELLIS